MSEKPEIEKLRVLHNLQNQFDVTDGFKSALKAQLSEDDQNRIGRFVVGFKIEDWFEWIFSAMPWSLLIHGLDQQQFPSRSKESFQVPDFLMLVETTALTHQPLLVEVKCVPRQKETLKIQGSQIDLCQNYATALNIPLVFAIYWEKLSGWTLNTPDTFKGKASTRKLPMTKAFEFDCSLILGDVSYFVPQSLTRISRFDKKGVSESSVRHEKYGRLVSDVAVLGNNRIEMNRRESAAIDSMVPMNIDEKRLANGQTELLKNLNENYMLKLSSWITRHLSLLNTKPTEQYANVSAHVISDLMNNLGCTLCHMFPYGRSNELKRLERLFMSSTDSEKTNH